MRAPWVDPDDGPARRAMIEADARQVVAHLEAARYAASIVFRESVSHNGAWEQAALDINRILESLEAV